MNPSRFGGAAGVGGWKELARTTLGSPSTTLDVSSIANKRYLQILISQSGSSGSSDGYVRYNADTGNCANRISNNGGAAFTNGSVNHNYIEGGNNMNVPTLSVLYMANYSSKEKLMLGHQVQQNTAGAANAPSRGEMVGKWANTSDVIDQLTLYLDSTYTYPTGAEMVVLGWDPADTHTTNFWEELASVDLIRWRK
jgi:hypothetical protein